MPAGPDYPLTFTFIGTGPLLSALGLTVVALGLLCAIIYQMYRMY